MGVTELLVLLLSLLGFGVEPNPQAPPAAEVLRYAPEAADYMIYIDAQALLPGNYKILTGLKDQPGIKNEPTLRKGVDMVVQQVDTVRAAAQNMLGIDIVNDIKSAAAWVQIADAGEPAFVLAVRGRFPKDVIEKIGGALNTKPEQIDGRPMLRSPDGDVAIALAADGVLIGGSPDLVKLRMRSSWTPVRGRAGSLLAEVAPALDAKPFFLVASAPSASTVRKIQRELGREREAAFFVDLLTGHTFAVVSFSHNGLSWTISARDVRGYNRAVLASEGMIELMRSFHLGVRGFSRLLLAALPSYAGMSKELDVVLQRQDDILKLVTATTGDGSFKAEVKKLPAKKTVTVIATGKELSEVLPAAGIVPFFGVGAWLAMGTRKSEAAPPARAPATLPKVSPSVRDK